MAALRHPNIVQVHDVGDVDGRPYFTMEFMGGGTLARKLAGMPLAPPDAARLAIVLASAVQAAHDAGIVHRDLKPGNVLLAADGTPKITDCGLARTMEAEHTLTPDGPCAGTPSYMAPEQVVGNAGASDPAVDIYSLGALLYELLTGRPPFRAETSAATLRQVVEEEPAPPSRLTAQVPHDLETICLKCLNKEPHGRYPSARAFAEDLQRFLRGEPITARRTGTVERAMKWVRRHPAPTLAAAATVLLLGISLVITERFLWSRAETLRGMGDDLAAVTGYERGGAWTQARESLERARGRLGQQDFPELHAQLIQADGDLQLVAKLAAIRLSRAAVVRNRLSNRQAEKEYDSTLTSAGVGLESSVTSAERITTSPIRDALVAALDDWAVCVSDRTKQDRIFAIARGADPDQWRNKVRDASISNNAPAILDLANTAPVAHQPVSILVALSERITRAHGDPKASIAFCRLVQREHPGDFWANYQLAYVLFQQHNPEAISYFLAALAVRPNTLAIYINLTSALGFHGRYEEALEYARRAVRVDPGSAVAHYNLGQYWAAMGSSEKAIAECKNALKIDPSYAPAAGIIGRALISEGRFTEAKAAADRCLALVSKGDPDYALAQGQAQECAAILEIDAALPDVLSGKVRPSPLDRRAFATVCLWKQRFVEAFRLFDEVFAADPALAADLGADARLQAASAAVRAAEQLKIQPGNLAIVAQERARLLNKALGWLRDELAAWSTLLDKGRESDRLWLQRKLNPWKADRNLAAIRVGDGSEVWSPEQQEQCRALWRDVNVLLLRAEAAQP